MGAGLDPAMITEGSSMANLVGKQNTISTWYFSAGKVWFGLIPQGILENLEPNFRFGGGGMYAQT